jgi:hypothetical protein
VEHGKWQRNGKKVAGDTPTGTWVPPVAPTLLAPPPVAPSSGNAPPVSGDDGTALVPGEVVLRGRGAAPGSISSAQNTAGHPHEFNTKERFGGFGDRHRQYRATHHVQLSGLQYSLIYPVLVDPVLSLNRSKADGVRSVN